MAKSTAIIAIAVLGALAATYLVASHLSKPKSQSTQDTYAAWKKEFKVIYGGPEDAYRYGVFNKTLASISAVNSQKLTYTLGLNEFSAMTDEEFAATKLGLPAPLLGDESNNVTTLPTANLKASIDWTGKGAVQHVKNQGSCGSCWSFSAVGALEGLSAISGKGLKDFAEQELVDCSRSYGNQGCSGGWPHWAFQYVKAKGIATQTQYPYKAVDGSCKTVSGDKFKIGGHVMVPARSAAQLKAALNKQPVAVALQADSTAFRNYKTGVVTGTACGTNLNHAVLAVGYNEAATPYYIVKNSWGTSWGDKGYIKIGIQDGVGVCGIQQQNSYPTL